jgi:hypothetical protein
MKLQIEWGTLLPLRDAGRDENLIYTFQHARLPEAPGVYVFGRQYGHNFEALYVGKASDIRGRVRGHLKNLPLMLHIQKAKNGKRVILTGRFVSKPGQQEQKCLTLLERALIRYFLSEGHDLVNKQGARLRRHEIIPSVDGAKIDVRRSHQGRVSRPNFKLRHYPMSQGLPPPLRLDRPPGHRDLPHGRHYDDLFQKC